MGADVGERIRHKDCTRCGDDLARVVQRMKACKQIPASEKKLRVPYEACIKVREEAEIILTEILGELVASSKKLVEAAIGDLQKNITANPNVQAFAQKLEKSDLDDDIEELKRTASGTVLKRRISMDGKTNI